MRFAIEISERSDDLIDIQLLDAGRWIISVHTMSMPDRTLWAIPGTRLCETGEHGLRWPWTSND